MTNEEIVFEIHQGRNVSENILLLYNKNLPIIKRTCKPFFIQAEEEDLLQTAFLSLYDIVKGFDSNKGYKFMTYAPEGIRRALIRYIDECCQTVRLPQYVQAKIIKYKKFCADFAMCNGRDPSDQELIDYFQIDKNELETMRKYAYAPDSLDATYSTEEDYTLADTIPDIVDMAKEVCEKCFNEQLWEVVQENLQEKHAEIIKARYIDGMTYKETEEVTGMPARKCRSMEHEASRKLSYGKARAKLKQKLDHEYDSRLYKNGKHGFDTHFSSQVERLALRTLEIKDEFYGVKDSIYQQA